MSTGFRSHERRQEDRFEQIRQQAIARRTAELPPPCAVVDPWEVMVDITRTQIPLSTRDQMRLRGAAETSEVVSEGRQHVNTRPQRHE